MKYIFNFKIMTIIIIMIKLINKILMITETNNYNIINIFIKIKIIIKMNILIIEKYKMKIKDI